MNLVTSCEDIQFEWLNGTEVKSSEERCFQILYNF